MGRQAELLHYLLDGRSQGSLSIDVQGLDTANDLISLLTLSEVKDDQVL